MVSYTTVSPLPRTEVPGGLFSVALSRGSPRVAVSHHPALWSPDVPREDPKILTRPSGRLVCRVDHATRRGEAGRTRPGRRVSRTPRSPGRRRRGGETERLAERNRAVLTVIVPLRVAEERHRRLFTVDQQVERDGTAGVAMTLVRTVGPGFGRSDLDDECHPLTWHPGSRPPVQTQLCGGEGAVASVRWEYFPRSWHRTARTRQRPTVSKAAMPADQAADRSAPGGKRPLSSRTTIPCAKAQAARARS